MTLERPYRDYAEPPEVEEAQKRLDEVTKRFEGGFNVYPVDGNHALSATGEPYIEVVSGVVDVAEGAHQPLWPSAAEAIAAFEQTLAYFNGVMGVLYWRMRPEIDVCREGLAWADHSCIGMWKIYSRFLISAKPVIYKATISDQEWATVGRMSGLIPSSAVLKYADKENPDGSSVS